jgi:hypothetical protein
VDKLHSLNPRARNLFGRLIGSRDRGSIQGRGGAGVKQQSLFQPHITDEFARVLAGLRAEGRGYLATIFEDMRADDLVDENGEAYDPPRRLPGRTGEYTDRAAPPPLIIEFKPWNNLYEGLELDRLIDTHVFEKPDTHPPSYSTYPGATLIVWNRMRAEIDQTSGIWERFAVYIHTHYYQRHVRLDVDRAPHVLAHSGMGDIPLKLICEAALHAVGYQEEVQP